MRFVAGYVAALLNALARSRLQSSGRNAHVLRVTTAADARCQLARESALPELAAPTWQLHRWRVAWFSVWVREVPGSIPGAALSRTSKGNCTATSHTRGQPLDKPQASQAAGTLCPSGLRGWTQVPLARAAWVQIPQVSLSSMGPVPMVARFVAGRVTRRGPATRIRRSYTTRRAGGNN